MTILFRAAVAFVAVIHLYIAWFEIFAWTVKGPEIFSQMPAEIFEPTIAMVAKSGIYNDSLHNRRRHLELFNFVENSVCLVANGDRISILV